MKQTPTATIIIPSRNQRHTTLQCLQCIRQYTTPPLEIIVVDNGSTDGTAEALARMPEVRLIRNDHNRGFAAASNQGIRAANGTSIVLLNNDTLPSYRWLANLLTVLRSDARIGLVGPLSNRVIPEQKVRIRFPTTQAMHAFCRKFHHRSNPAKWRTSPRLSGFCMAFPAGLVERIGLLDERFGMGTYEDDDYCYRARLAGYRCVIAGDTYVHHLGNRTFRKRGREEFKKILAQNRRYFIDKWGITPEAAARGVLYKIIPK